MSKFEEVFGKLKGKEGTMFSRTDFDSLMASLLNEKEYEMVYVKGIDKETGNPITETSKPIEKFRDLLVKILVKAKVDKEDAVAIVDAYSFSKADASVFYEIFNEILDQYLRAGKNFRALKREDYNLQLSMQEVEEKVNEGVVPARKDGDKVIPEVAYKVKSKKHKKIKASSGCPDHLKVKLV